jgi:hypothetical protein
MNETEGTDLTRSSYISSGEEAFQPELISNPYIQRMFQVCTLHESISC